MQVATVARNWLADGGLVSDKLPGFELRPQQLDMAAAVADAFEAGEHLIVEAGTGIGKSFAYLIPAIAHAIKHGRRVVISTHTIALQEQLIDKDIPFLQTVFPDPFSAVLVKGRSNYLGLRRLARASEQQKFLFDAKGELSELHAIESWAYKTQDGSLSDMPRQPDPTVWDRARSDADDCLGRKCPHFEACFYQRARRRAGSAQLLIVNHAMLFSDLALRRRGASILPDYDYVVLDEAHTVERVAGDHLGLGVASTQVQYLLNNLHNERTGRGLLSKGTAKHVLKLVHHTHRRVGAYFDELASWSAEQGEWSIRLREPPPVPNVASSGLLELRDALRDVREDTEDDQRKLELAASIGRCAESAQAIDDWHEQKSSDCVYWLELGRGRRARVSLNARPVDVGPALREALFDPVKSVVLTSATLTTRKDSSFKYMKGRVGLEDSRSLCLGSPFDYRSQLKVYVEAGMPDPSNAAFVPAACEAISKYVAETKGRAFALFTSYQMLTQCAKRLGAHFESEKTTLLVQGSGMPRSKMLAKFRKLKRGVLFGTDSFWAGVDVPGEALSNVIIVKLPFAAPNHPIIEARLERIRASGGNPFRDFQLPEAILKFRQGVGRLIRTRRDTGIVAILDPRVVSKPYGKSFLKALPECEVVIQGSTRPTTA